MNDDPKPAKNRSPNHPYLDLESAIGKTRELYAKFKCVPAPLLNACKTMGYNSVYSTSNQAVAALKAYGLIDVTGIGHNRKVAVSHVGERIVRGAPDSGRLVQAAALAPFINQEVYDHFDGALPHDEILEQYLVWEREEGTRFNQEVVHEFISKLRSTLKFAGLEKKEQESAENELDTSNNTSSPSSSRREINVGAFVQWTSQGIAQFKNPRKVVGISDDGAWAFVEGSQTGVPVSELTLVENSKPPVSPNPPINPHFSQIKNDDDKPLSGGVVVRTILDEGPVRLEWPDNLSPESFEEFNYWIQGILNRAQRKAGLKKGSTDEE